MTWPRSFIRLITSENNRVKGFASRGSNQIEIVSDNDAIERAENAVRPALPRKHPRPSTPPGDAVEQGVRA